MSRILFLACFFISFVTSTNAAPGDTTIVYSHNNTNLASPPTGYDAWAVFPDDGKQYRSIIMKFTLGCGIPNCSGWDYTVNISFGKKSGALDSTFVSTDPVSGDTIWNYVNFLEIGRLITPYGTYMANNSNGYNNSWTHPYYFDVTDYAAFLKDSIKLRVYYDGWTDAFSASVEFIMIEGQPLRTVQGVKEIYHTYIQYPNSAAFESVAVPKSFLISPTVASAKVALIMTGHGSQGEFDPRHIYLKVNGDTVYTRLLWKNDCGMTAIAPQGGTWLINRANWCPGEQVRKFEIDITDYITPGQFATIDLDFEDYAVQPGEGAGYGTSAHLVTYSNQPVHDVMLEEIIAPNSGKPYARFNPACANPIVKIKNTGQQPLTYAEISYWVKGGSKWYYEWTGNLSVWESETITLPAFDWNSADNANTTFIAEVNWSNEVADEYVHNNRLESNFEITPVMVSAFIINLRTNNRPEENWYVLRNENGDTILFRDGFTANTTHRDTVSLPHGSYALDLYDYDPQWDGGDGLSWWFNVQQGLESGGMFNLRDIDNAIIRNFNGDFGSNIHYEFTVGYSLGNNPPKTPPDPPARPTSIQEIPDGSQMIIFPNPAQDVIHLKIEMSKPAGGKIFMTDISGKIMMQFDYHTSQGRLIIPAHHFPRGMYFAGFVSESERIYGKVILQ